MYRYLHLQKKPNFIFLYMSFIPSILLALRLFLVTDDELCDTKNEPMCGHQTCSISGTRHIAWNIRLRAHADICSHQLHQYYICSRLNLY